MIIPCSKCGKETSTLFQDILCGTCSIKKIDKTFLKQLVFLFVFYCLGVLSLYEYLHLKTQKEGDVIITLIQTNGILKLRSIENKTKSKLNFNLYVEKLKLESK